jgi:hypothetical protein
MHTQRSFRRSHGWLLATGLLVLGVGTAGASSKQLVYSGTKYGDRQTKVQLRVAHNGSGSGSFTATNVLLYCDDETQRRVDFPPLKVHLRADQHFVGHVYQRQANGDQSFFRVSGQIDGRQAAGRLFGLLDADPGPYEPDRPDCFDVPRKWRASR